MFQHILGIFYHALATFKDAFGQDDVAQRHRHADQVHAEACRHDLRGNGAAHGARRRLVHRRECSDEPGAALSPILLL